MSVIRAFDNAFNRMQERNWREVYICIDVHETILYPDYNNKEELKYYPLAKETLQLLSKRGDIILILYTCSYPEEIERYLNFFKDDEINFKYVNKNPEAENTKYGYYRDKPYFNVLLDDKAGFDAESDWKLINTYINQK